MKSLIKFFPVAVGVLALASCSNDDFFGSSSEDGKLELVATVAAPAGSDDGLITRSTITPAENVADYSTSWQAEDVFRVYDAALQKYDTFSYKDESKKITIDTESPKVTEYAKAIFPAASVSYAGWSADNDAVTATVFIDPTPITYKPAVKVGEKTAYVSNLPMWGDATMEDDHLAVKLNPLTAYADITVNGAYTSKIRVISANTTSLEADGTTTKAAFQGDINADATILSTKAPLTGYFDALLKTDYTDSYLVADYEAPLGGKNYGYIINVNMGTNAADEAHVIIPIVPQTYECLIIQYWDDKTDPVNPKWVTKKEYKNQAVANNIVLRKDLSIGTSVGVQAAKVSKFEDIQTRLDQFKTDANPAKILDINLAAGVAADAIKTSAGKQTITIPDYTEEKIINLNFDITDTDYNLTIENKNTETTVLNLQTVSGNVPVTIKQGGLAAEKTFVITGEINSTGSGELKRLNISGTGNLTLGLGDFGPFKSNMNLYLTANVSNLYIDAAKSSTIPAIDGATAANTSAISIESGTVTAIGGTTAAATRVTVERDGKVTTLKTVGGDVTIQNGGNVTTTAVKDVKDGDGDVTTPANVTVGSDEANDASATATTITAETGAVAIKANAIVTSLTSAVTGTTYTITAAANIGTLNLSGVAPNVTLNGATAANKAVVKIENLKTTVANKKQIVTLVSTDKAAVGTVTLAKTGEGGDEIDATSSITATNAADVKATYFGSANEIYTAAQLAGVTTGKAYKLCTKVTATGKWTPVNISKDFDGNGKEIKGLNAPLFGTISGGTVKNLTLNNVTIASKAANQGALAQIVNGTVNIEGITVAGTSTIGAASTGDGKADANSKNIGGLVGKAKGTVALKNNKVNATIQGFANVGGYIGNFESGKVTMTVEHASDYQSAVVFKMTFKPDVLATASNANYGTFGYFIGSITGTSEVAINKKETGKGDAVTHYFAASGLDVTEGDGDTKLCFKRNKKIENSAASAWFVGMVHHEFGYSAPGSIAAGKLVLYSSASATDAYGNPVTSTLSVDDINKFVTTEP